MRPDMAALTYGEQLRGVMDQLPVSQRRLSFQLAEKTGNTQESERRALGKYLSGKEVPSVDRAAILAVLLQAPTLALVPDAVTRRRGRLAELEARIDELERLLNEALPRLDQAMGETQGRVDDLEKRQQPKPQTASRTATR